ncbi:helicase [Acidovorax sp. GBBC 3332]|nr:MULTISPECIES: helicase-related protein [unclassified Acidovorax]MDA8449227.1 helicase [Acidovorax sp. GBBC 3297]MDA8458685.1 helicase [Acidovorax sp. GBBC 3333]MDA8463983.1 helicase [Acidovorax sp. GBBC 3332]MDA8469015.1 helicase [Acidovorax sp. GBBC 3299]WCM80613.1 helicase [Acidovorax sp. GBBC 712]
MENERFRADVALAPLKVFQRRTVDYVFDRLYGQDDPVRQFLVADEVGLGKTMVARGVIARMIEHLWDNTKRIDILYICSNQAIAAQNLNRLNVLGRRELALPTRMTLVPLQLRDQAGLDANKVNFISLTPGTTFDLRSATGVTLERALLFHLLRDLVTRPRGLQNLLQVNAGVEGWSHAVDNLTLEGVDERITARFRRDVQADRDLFEELERVCEMFPRRRETYPAEMTQPRNSLVARLRAKLSHACVDALKPDLIIMDEFQRFPDLLHGDSDAAMLARELFEYSGGDGHAARTLLLSATPYRMLTLAGDHPDDGDHYQDFLETLSFLYGRQKGPELAATLAREMRAFRGLLHALPQSHASAVEARQTIERRLRRVIARTERVASTVERDSMMSEPPIAVSIAPADVAQASAVSQVARALNAPEIIEYWKSSPYLLNFMRHYSLKRLLEDQADAPTAVLRNAIQAARSAMLDHDTIDAYAPLDPANGRMRAIMDDVFGQQLEQNLWIPAALPYYGEARAVAPLTKALIFSSWSMVPEAIAALVSYEAERLMGVGESGRRYFEQHRLRPLQFRQDHGRLTGLRTLLLIYPSPTLAELADPLAVLSETGATLSLEGMRSAVGDRLKSALGALNEGAVPHQDAHSAEWAAPAVIDDLLGARSRAWLEASHGMRALASEDAFNDHVAELAAAAKTHDIGASSDDLSDLLVDVALGSPAVCALRALKRIAPELAWDDPRLLSAAAEVAWSFRALFNQHDAVALLRRDTDDHYWRRVLAYCAQHNLQAVLDEYAHYLVDAEGLSARPAEDRATGVARAMAQALAIRPSQIDVDDVRVDGESLAISKFQMRGRFAMRLADYKDEDGAVARLGGVRDAFNSPFRPFVLATTSVGQEGLDFHPYCYRVYHWNLPGNPVDLEQREGRVHRFKGHAVRLNLAERQAAVVRGYGQTPDDPWKLMFECARSEAEVDTDLVPYWIYEGSVRVERRVPILPFSREVTRLAWLKHSLAVYRLAFGQPRQDELLDYFHSLIATGFNVAELESLQIRLEPSPNS